MINPYLLFGKQDREGATSLDAYLTPGERDNKQVDKPTDCGKCYKVTAISSDKGEQCYF